jgi:transposase
LPAVSDMFGPTGTAQLERLELPAAYATKLQSLRRLIAVYDAEIGPLDEELRRRLTGDRGYVAIQAIHGIGPAIAAILVAEIGDIARFRSAPALCCWAGLTPRHRDSDTKVLRGPITKQGSALVRWALIEAISRYHGGPGLAANYRAIAARRGTNKARVAVARKVLTLVYYGMRDGEIRCLASPTAA